MNMHKMIEKLQPTQLYFTTISDQTAHIAQLTTNMSLGQSPLLSLPNLTSHAKVVAM